MAAPVYGAQAEGLDRFDNYTDWAIYRGDKKANQYSALDQINAWIPYGELVDLSGPTYAEGAGYGMTANLYGGG